MASRKEQKERLREERLAAEAAEKRAGARARRLRLVFGGIIGILAVGGVAFALIKAAEGGSGDPETEAAAPKAVAKLPEPQTTNLEDAVEKAGCKLIHAKYEGAGHEEKKFTKADYKSNPPTSGIHFPTWYEDGVYEPGGTPEAGQLVHTLEHGRINVQYKPGTPKTVIDQLEAFSAEKTGYHILVHENGTDMPYQVAVTGWTQLAGCEKWSPAVVDVLRTFYQEYVDKGPEQVP